MVCCQVKKNILMCAPSSFNYLLTIDTALQLLQPLFCYFYTWYQLPLALYIFYYLSVDIWGHIFQLPVEHTKHN
jgi:hypothetical protein